MRAKSALQKLETLLDGSQRQSVFEAWKRSTFISASLEQRQHLREDAMSQVAFRALHAHSQESIKQKGALQDMVMVRKSSTRRNAFDTFRRNVQLEVLLRFYQRQREVARLLVAFRALRNRMHEEIRLRHLLKQVQAFRSRQRLRDGFSSWHAHTQTKLSHAAISFSVADARASRRQRRSMSIWHGSLVKALGTKTMLRKRKFRILRWVIRAMRWLVANRCKAHNVLASHEASSAHSVMHNWNLAARTRGRMRFLPEPVILSARRCVSYWAYEFDAPAMLMTWQLQAFHQKRERQASMMSGNNDAKSIQKVLLEWSAMAFDSQAVQWRFRWQRTLRAASQTLQAWSLHTRLMAAAWTRHAHCSWRLLRCIIRWWRFAVVERRAELELQVGALRAWGFGAAQCRCARDETLRGRWADEVAEAFAMRRLLRLVLHGFAAWSLHASDVRVLRTRLRGLRETDLKCVAFSALRQHVALTRFSNVEALFNGLAASSAMQTWRIFAKASMVASTYHAQLQRGVLQALRVGCQQRQSCSRLANTLEHHLCGQAISRWQSYADRSHGTEESASSRIAMLRCSGALKALQTHGQAAAKKAALPRLLRAWRQLCRASHFTRRLELSRGLRKWQAFGRGCWASRRRLAVAILLATRRLLQSAWLPWQLLCFTKTPDHNVLVERWSDAVAAPGVLRPLMGLQASNITNGNSIVDPDGKCH